MRWCLTLMSMKRFWIIVLYLFLLGNIPSIAHMQMDEPIEAEIETITLSIQDNKAHVTNAEGKTLEIYNLTGVRVARIRIDNNDKHITLKLNRGCYIMKVDKIVRKVTIL